MALATIADKPLSALTVLQPRRGRWTTTFALEPDDTDTPPDLSSPVRLVIDANDATLLDLTGMMAGTLAFGTVVGTGRGGKGDIGKTAKPVHYRSTTLRRIVEDLLATAGESLSSTSDASLLAQQFEEYSVHAQPIGVVLAKLMEVAGDGFTWRFTDDGALWLGKDTFPAFTGDWNIVSELPIDNAVDIVMGASHLPRPGESLDGRNIEMVQTRIDSDGIFVRVFFA